MMKKILIKNFLSLFFSNVIGQLFILWAFVYIARVCGPDGFGKFSFAQVVALYFIYLADFGLLTLGTRAIAQERGEIQGLVRHISALRLVLALICFAALVIFALALSKSVEVRNLILIFGFSLFAYALVLEWVFQGIEEMEYVGLSRILKGAVFAGLVLLTVVSPGDLLKAAGAYAASIAVAAVVLIAVYLRKFGNPLGRIHPAVLRTTLAAAVPLAAGSFITQVNYNFGTFALGLSHPDATVGLFSAAYKITLFLWAFVAVAASNAVLPLLARTYTQSLTAFRDTLKSLMRVFIIIAVPLGIGGSVLAKRIMALLYPPEYTAAALVLQISIWTVVIVLYRVVIENALIASKSQRSYFIGYMGAGMLTVIGNIVLVPSLGMIAPPIVGVFTEGVLLVYFIVTCKYMHLSYIVRMTFKPLTAGVLMGLAINSLPFNVVVVGILGSIMYLLFLILVKGISVREVVHSVDALVR